MVRTRLWLLITLCVQTCAGRTQFGSDPDTVNSTVCRWMWPRVGVVRDAVYIDGGDLVLHSTATNGTQSDTSYLNIPGYVFILNFSTPFQTTLDFDQGAIFSNISYVRAGEAARGRWPGFFDGAMLANYYEWWTYGGLPSLDGNPSDDPTEDFTGLYQAYSSERDAVFSPGFDTARLPNDVSSYLAWGAGVSVPSENLGFYFGGLQSKTGGPISFAGDNTTVADTPSSHLIQVSMYTTPQGNATWSNNSISHIPTRASAELVWVPVSEQGILVAIGGVTNLIYATDDGVVHDSADTSKRFMETVAVYDIQSKNWYTQNTTGSIPPGLAQGCSVVASAEDGSSHNIYWYGGFDGVHPEKELNDVVWILSIPSFTWVKLNSGRPAQGRAGHRCVTPYPDQMFVIGGFLSTAHEQCLPNAVDVLNLTSGEWQKSYDPTIHSQYQVPDAVISKIGGSGSGSATLAAPSPSGFDSTEMTAIFKSAYATSRISTYYPYYPPTQAPSASSPVPPPAKSGRGTPSYLAPVLAVILGLFFITLVVIGVMLWRRRKTLSTRRNTTISESGTTDIMGRVAGWIIGTPGGDKAPTVSTEYTPPVPDKPEKDDVVQMIGGDQLFEMDGTSHPTELNDTGLVETEAHDATLRETGMVSAAHTPLHELASKAQGSDSRPVSTSTLPGADSSTAIGSNARATSVSPDFDHGHVREHSEVSISTARNRPTSVEPGTSQPPAAGGHTATPKGQRAGAVSPLTPSELGGPSGGEFLSRGRGLTLEGQPRASNFSEQLDEGKSTK